MAICPHCNFSNTDGRTICKSCGKAFSEPPTAPAELQTLDRRRAVLQAEIARQVAAGWRVTTQTETTASFTKQGSANALITLLLLLCAILPGILYALLARPTLTLFVQVDDYGRVQRTGG
jgi:hypothetical protein